MSNITASASGPLLGVKILDLTQYQVRRPASPAPCLCALTPRRTWLVVRAEWPDGYDDDG